MRFYADETGTVLIVPTEELRPGAKLAVGVMHPRQREQELLKSGFVLDDDVIARLRELGVSHVFVDFPGLDDLDAMLLPLLSPERRAVYELIKSAIASNETSVRPVVKYSAYRSATRAFIKSLVVDARNAVLLDVLSRGSVAPESEIEHATTVAHLALVLGMKLEAYLIRERPRLTPAHARDLTGLGVAAMLHDIGKTKLPEHLRRHHALDAPPGREDLALWQSHAQLGFELLRGDVDAAVSATVLHHHQRFDGGGFPELPRGTEKTRLGGRRIHIFARILQAADLFERLANRADGTRRTNYETLHLLRVHYSGHLDPEVLATMPQVIPPFGPGRRVTLSDGGAAIVTGFHPHSPYQPPVKRFDIAQQKAADDAVDLRMTPGLTITHIDGVTLAGLEAVRLAQVA